MQYIGEWRMLVRGATLVAGMAVVAACGGRNESSGGASTSTGGGGPSAESAAPAATSANGPSTGVVDTVSLSTDATGNYFKPNSVTVHRGDVIRFVLSTGVHNVDFLADSNAGKSGLPAPSALLQLPGQTLDVPVTFPPGTYYFQCDPHAALGMRGHVVVKG
jgi:plastocyanin